MVKLIMGLSGSGKTKTLVSLVREAMEESRGDVVCIERKNDLMYEIPSSVRLIHANEHGINTNQLLAGFLCGLHAGNYDITHIFIDDFYKIIDDRSDEAVERFLSALSDFSERENIRFTLTATADPAAVSEGIRKYL